MGGARASPQCMKRLAQILFFSLLACIDRTVTSGGARELASRLARPLLDVEAIDRRLDAVAWLLERRTLRRDLRDRLKGSGDTGTSDGRDRQSHPSLGKRLAFMCYL